VRRFCWPLILFQFVWLNIVVPGHTRGFVTIGQSCDGQSCTEQTPAGQAASCCSNKSHNPASKSPTPDQQKRCAICAFAAALSTPPVVVFKLVLLGGGGSIFLSAPTSALTPELSSTNRERAPPVTSV